MNIPTRSNHPNTRLAYLEKAEEREIWHKLVVKIINWKDGLLAGGTIKFTDKITSKEWKTYSSRTIEINSINNKQRVLNSLKETKEIIKKYGGFE